MASSKSVPESYVDVLIIGAGPAGVMCGNALAHAGVKVRVVDKRPGGLEAGQADACMPRTVEIMQSYGLAERFLKESEHVWHAAYYNPTPNGGVERSAVAPLINAPNARYPFTPMFHQGGMERIFCDSMRTKGVEVERPTIPTSLKLSENERDLKDPHAYAVKATIKHLEGSEDDTEIIHAKFVLGSDGAHSWVRKVLGIQVEGDTSDSIFGVIDLWPDTNFPDTRKLTFVHSIHGVLLIIPRENNMIRLYIQQPSNSFIDPNTGRVDKNRTSPEEILRQGQKILQPFRMEAIGGKFAWWTVYVVGQRVAERYSQHNRIFIAGDACHTHSPKAGQGMNASMADTHNLAWKIAYVLRGWANLSTLLPTYESERRTFAQNLIAFDKKYSKVFAGKPRTADYQDGVSHEEFFKMHKTASLFTSGIGVHYGPSVVVNVDNQSYAPKMVIGERVIPQVFICVADGRPYELHDLLPADTRFKILVFAGDITVHDNLARLNAVADQFNSPNNFVRRYGRGAKPGEFKVFDIMCFTSAKRHEVDWLDFPEFFRPHWKKQFYDDMDDHNLSGGGGYARYGIDPNLGAVVVVRPDGFVGNVTALDGIEDLNAYFSGFMVEGN